MSSDVSITATWQKGKKIDYWIFKKDVTIPEDGGSSPSEIEENSFKDLWQELRATLKGSVEVSCVSKDERESIWLTLQGFGRTLCNRLLSSELRKFSAKWPEGSVVCIGTNAGWIPWELIHDGNKFWGSKFILSRIPKVPKEEFLPSDTTVERSPSTYLRKIVNVIGGDLPSTIVERIKEIFTIYKPPVDIKDIEQATLSKVLQAIADADLIHFTCHGRTDDPPNPYYLQLSDDRHIAYRLTLRNLESLALLPDSLVFVNACLSDTIDEFLGKLFTFGWVFYKKGAAAYIGTLGPVPTEHAVTFSEYFYKKLQSGCTVGESLRHAKLLSGSDNPFWLLYTLYGDPFSQKVFISNP